MNWFLQAFSETSILWLVISTLFAVASGFTTSWLTYRYVKRKEIVEQVLADIEKQRITRQEDAEALQHERIRQEVIRWANPILASIQILKNRLHNILDKHEVGYIALSKDYKKATNPRWSITYDYFMESTLFLFAQYFAWVRIFEEELSFEMFRLHKKKDEFRDAIHEVRSALGSFPPKDYKCSGPDAQIFSLQQRAIGELMIVRSEDGARYCISYPEFAEKMNELKFHSYFKPLIELLDELKPSDDCRWKRILATRKALENFENYCKRLLELP